MCLEILTFYGRLTVPEHHFKHCCFFFLLYMLGADMRCFALVGESFVRALNGLYFINFMQHACVLLGILCRCEQFFL